MPAVQDGKHSLLTVSAFFTAGSFSETTTETGVYSPNACAPCPENINSPRALKRQIRKLRSDSPRDPDPHEAHKPDLNPFCGLKCSDREALELSCLLEEAGSLGLAELLPRCPRKESATHGLILVVIESRANLRNKLLCRSPCIPQQRLLTYDDVCVHALTSECMSMDHERWICSCHLYRCSRPASWASMDQHIMLQGIAGMQVSRNR